MKYKGDVDDDSGYDMTSIVVAEKMTDAAFLTLNFHFL